ncbi:MAG: hypothetical protein ABSG93_02295 [Solirubrobacteraceae bacterium]|jgi:hypothetical protein
MPGAAEPDGGAADSRRPPQRSCPSGRSIHGASLIGIVGPDARLGYLNEAIPLDDLFLEKVRGRAPMQRFRFSEPCVEAGCAQWTGSRCGLIDEVLDSAKHVPEAGVARLPRCPIRRSCRWFHQVGRDACLVCPFIVRGGDEHEDEWALVAPGIDAAT